MKTKDLEKKKKNTEHLKRQSRDLGMDFFGVAGIEEMKKDFLHIDSSVLEGFNCAISMGVRLLKSVLDDIQDKPTPLYLHHYRQINYLLDRAALSISRAIQNEGFQALPVTASQVIDWENQRGHVSHKAIAIAAGHGWLGRNNLLVHPQYGAQVRLVSVLTDYPLMAGVPLKSSCGRCRTCISVCPASAIQDTQINFNHKGCYEMLRMFKTKANIGHYICGICVKACNGEFNRPVTRKSQQTGSFYKTEQQKK